MHVSVHHVACWNMKGPSLNYCSILELHSIIFHEEKLKHGMKQLSTKMKYKSQQFISYMTKCIRTP